MRGIAVGPTFPALIIILISLLVICHFVSLSITTVIINLLIYTALAYSINFITGLTGYVSFGHVTFMGVGAYGLGMVSSFTHMHPLLGVLFGAFLGSLFALSIGLVTLRFRGVYFAISTLVMALSAELIVVQIPQVGGSIGMILNVGFLPFQILYTIWTIVLIELVLTYQINRGKLGLGIRAIKNDEDAAKTIGINSTKLKLYLFTLSGLTAGAAGAVFSWSTSAVYPSVVFQLIFSLQMLAMIIIGGMGTSIGPLLGAAIVYLLYFYFLTIFPGAQLVVIGLLVTLMALFLPEGIIGAVRKKYENLRTVLE